MVHASPEWSNERGAGAPKQQVAKALLAEFLRAAGADGSGGGGTAIDPEADVLYLEAHAWSNA